LVMDAEQGPADQDEKIAGLILEIGCSVILMLNKWDLHKTNVEFSKKIAAERIRDMMRFLNFAPILFSSAKEKEGLRGLGDLITQILTQRRVKIPTHEFSEWVRKESAVHNPLNAKFYLCHQSGRNPPTFTCHVNSPTKINTSLERHLINAIREKWGFMGSPVRMRFVEAKGKMPPIKTTTK